MTRGNEVETYSKRFNGGKLLHDGFLLCEISGTDSKSGRSNNGKTDWDTHDQENQGVMEEGVGALLWGRYSQVMEETTNPGSENPENDENQERCTDGVHDRLEMALILGSRDERGSATDEGHLGGVSDNSISLSTFAASGVVDDICDVLVDGERLSSHGRLIDGQKSVSRTVLLLAHCVFLLFTMVGIVAQLSFQFALILGPAVGVVVTRDDAAVSGDDLAVLDNNLKLLVPKAN